MRKTLIISASILLSSVFFLFSCSKDDGGGGGNNGNPCDTVIISVSATATAAVPCPIPATNGTITVTATGSTGFTYSLDGGAFTANNTFTSVSEGNHTVRAKDINGCEGQATVTVNRAFSGQQFTAMRFLVNTRCGSAGCHMNGSSAGSVNFDNDCSIVSRASQINNQCIVLNRMPPGGSLSQPEKDIITNWIGGGAGYSN